MPQKTPLSCPLLLLLLALSHASNVFAADGDGVTAPAASVSDVVLPPDSGFEDFADLSLALLLDERIDVATHAKTSIRRSPAIITVINKADIRASGARDLLDVLRLVPGLQAGIDVWASVGLAVRGLWAIEGKVLVLIDDIDITELAYGTTPLLMRIAVQSIERVEIIRGPGSVLYGGFAELAVIRIVTATGLRQSSARASLGYGHTPSGYGHGQGEFAFNWADEDPDGLAVAAAGSYSRASGTNRVYYDLYGDAYLSQSGNRFDSTLANVTAAWRGARLRYFHNRYNEHNRDLYDEILPSVAHAWVEQQTIQGLFEREVRDHLSIAARADATFQAPYNLNRPAEFEDDTRTRRTQGFAQLAYAPASGFGGLAGGGFQRTYAKSAIYEFLDGYTLSMNNGVAFGQVDYTHAWFNLYAGARLEKHEYAGTSLVPRLAATGLFGDAHAKFMVSRAFRAPTVNNVSGDPDIDPEYTTTVEAEIGYRPVTEVALTLNLFNNRVKDTITYFYDADTNFEGYENGADAGTRGLETEIKLAHRRVGGSLSYSFYHGSVSGNDVSTLIADANLALAKHKLAGWLAYRPVAGLSLTPSAVLLSKRSGFVHDPDAEDDYVEATFPTTLWLNFFARYELKWVPGLAVGAGVFNLADVHQDYLQPYDSGHGVFPDRSREVLGRVEYEVSF